ncbi:hypothetical protein BDC45DRAFT_194757 [Circinella umbellata]|nr:hypothetical protein BDC45DRAFT_194757 [Circinella umbellata]
MDNNPFRSQNTNMYSSPMSGQSQYPQTNAMPQQTTTHGFNPSSYSSPLQQPQHTAYNTSGYSNTPYQQQQQQPNNNYQTAYPQQQSMYGQQQQPSFQTSYPQQQQSFQQPSYPQQQSSYQPFQQQQQQPMYWQTPQQQAQPYNPSTAFIPSDFGLSTNNNNNANQFQQQPQQSRQPQHAPVDANAYLKGNQVRKMECPVCHKTIEGDNMALNHHVNEHLEYDM